MDAINDRLNALAYLKELIAKQGDNLQAVIQRTYHENRWLTPDNCQQALQGISEQMLAKEALAEWLKAYDIPDKVIQKKVGLILAGNIPAVGFHDWLSVFVSGHKAVVKLSAKDARILPYLIQELELAFPQYKGQTEFVERLQDVDAIIATGSNNSARYFEHYFGKYPNIIRKNRNGVGILTGKESRADLLALGQDIFSYFGLGCRSISKIFVPRDFDFPNMMEVLHDFNKIVLNNKYMNNFDYQRTILLLNQVPHFINGSVICLEGESYASSVATLHYEYYNSLEEISDKLQKDAEQIQCISAGINIAGLATIPFGEAQRPKLNDYADGVDTLSFLNSL